MTTKFDFLNSFNNWRSVRKRQAEYLADTP